MSRARPSWRSMVQARVSSRRQVNVGHEIISHLRCAIIGDPDAAIDCPRTGRLSSVRRCAGRRLITTEDCRKFGPSAKGIPKQKCDNTVLRFSKDRRTLLLGTHRANPFRSEVSAETAKASFARFSASKGLRTDTRAKRASCAGQLRAFARSTNGWDRR